ncbi:AraC family transcriptional regulator [uncultured Aquimarina sp.]|uniref:AraC family transcriptional regulator n=1 Tax=uncultured Aquimarina sp. TaxID=575652 RepID=UPI00262B7B74|nr:AraC family transcriptional regulator [uncultured Aquimarina sp.]
MQTHHIKKQKIILMIFVFIITTIGYTQKIAIPDSLQTKSFNEIEVLLYEQSSDSIKAVFFSNILLAKAKQEQEQDSLNLAKAYFQVSFNNVQNPLKRIAYLDSSITSNPNIKHSFFPVLAYINRAGTYKEIGNYEKALDDYLSGLKYTDKVNTNIYQDIKHNIARLKNEIGEYEEAKEMYMDIMKYESSKNIEGRQHLITVLGLVETYRKLKQFDSASYYANKGIKESIKDSLNVYHSFLLAEGINLYYKDKYNASIENINKSIPVIKKIESHNMGIIIDGYLHLSKIYKKLDDKEMLIQSLQNIDWYFENTNYRSIEMREAYELFINHYKSIDDKNQQLYYINKLFAVDSILDSDYKNLNKTITKKYDTPKLLEEKEKLIEFLEKKDKTSSLKFSIALLLILILTIVFGYVYYRNIQYKRRYEAIMHPKNEPETKPTEPSVVDQKNTETDPKTIDIPENIVQEILERLTQFENKNGFLARNLTITVLAKKLNTNSKYLSKIINQYKQKRFSVYINELRVDYVIEQLKENPKFRLYSIKGIARELGYNNDRAFSKAFYQKTGVYPSYFIKKLSKEVTYT